MSLNVPLSSNFQIKQTENPLHSSLMGPSEEEVEQIQVGAMKVYRFIVGIDRNIKTMEEGEASCELNDPFANLILKKGLSPLTAGEVVKEFEKTKNLEGGLADFHTFIIAEGGQIPWNEKTQSINRYTRLIFAMTTKKGIGPDVLMSTETDVDSENPFLEVMSWDSKHKAYNFYQRLRASWIWSGNSFFALNDQSRFKGPFSGHTNGGPIMKELREPWQHWSSSSAIIKETAFEPNDPFRNNSYFLKKKNGDQFEQLIRSGIHFWNQSRIEKALQENKIQNPIHLLRQILMTTNVNLVSTIYCSRSLDPSSEVQLPFSFFANLEALSHT